MKSGKPACQQVILEGNEADVTSFQTSPVGPVTVVRI